MPLLRVRISELGLGIGAIWVGEGFEKEENLRIKALNHNVIGDCEGEREAGSRSRRDRERERV